MLSEEVIQRLKSKEVLENLKREISESKAKERLEHDLNFCLFGKDVSHHILLFVNMNYEVLISYNEKYKEIYGEDVKILNEGTSLIGSDKRKLKKEEAKQIAESIKRCDITSPIEFKENAKYQYERLIKFYPEYKEELESIIKDLSKPIYYIYA